MKLRKWIAITTVLALLGMVGCSPAADTPAATGDSSGATSSSATTGDPANSTAAAGTLEALKTADYKAVHKIEDMIPADANLSGKKADGTPWKIGWSSMNNAQESMAYMTSIMEDMAKEYGFELITFDGQNDPQKQTSDVNSAITQGCDALIIAPIDPSSQNPVMKRAMDQGILVINVQNVVDDSICYDMYVGPDDVQAGQLAASYLIENMPEGGKVVTIDGNPGETCQINRAKGFAGVMAGYPQFEILEEQSAQAWSTAEAMSLMESYMSKYPKIDAVYCHWDIGAAAAIQAAETAGRADQMVFLGVDGVQDALNAIATGGPFKSTSLQDFELASTAQTMATLACLNGDRDKLEKDLYVDFVCITKDNASNFSVGW